MQLHFNHASRLMRALVMLGLVLGLALITTSPASANSAVAVVDTPTITLQQALDAAWQRSLTQAQTSGDAHTAQARQQAAQRFWASSPSAEIVHRNARLQPLGSGAHEGYETQALVSLPLWWPGQHRAAQQ